MAPMAIYEPQQRKRSASDAHLDNPSRKKIQSRQSRHHKATWDPQQSQRRDASLQDGDTAEALLTRAISLALEAVGFEAVGPMALESFRMNVEECMALQICGAKSRAYCIRHGAFLGRRPSVYAVLSSRTSNSTGLPASSTHPSA